MHVLNAYLLRLMMKPFLFVVFVLLLALSLERLLRLIEVVSDVGAPLSHVFELLVYLLPHYLGLALPAAGFLAVLLAFRALHEHSELNILQSSGIGLRQVLQPVVLFSCLITLVVLVLVAYVQPHTRYAFSSALHGIKEQPIDLNLRAGVFQQFGERVTIRVDESTGTQMRGFFAAVEREGGGVSYLSAKAAEIVPAEDGAPLTLRLIDGRRVSHKADGSQSVFEFAVFPWTVNAELMPYGARGEKSARELVLWELGDSLEQRAEFHARVVHALSLPFLALLAIPLALIGQGRTGKASGIVLGVIVIVLYEKILGFGEAFAVAESLPAVLALWGPWMILGWVSVLVFMMEAELR